MTQEEREHVRHIASIARAARRDLGMNAGDGAKARPTVAQLNSALATLAEIENSARHALAANLPSAEQ